MMKALSETGRYEITAKMREQLSDFAGGFAGEQETAAEIKSVYERAGYVLDTHTAVASFVGRSYRETTKDDRKMLIASTASPYKFTRSVMEAIDGKYDGMEDFALADKLAELSGVPVPAALEEIRTAQVLHKTVCEVSEMEAVVKNFLGV